MPQARKGKKANLPPVINIEDAEIRFRNFSGKEGRFNVAGRRNFCVILQPEDGDRLRKEGWNVKVLKPREEGDEPLPYIQVTVSYKVLPPKIVIINSSGRGSPIGEEDLAILDWADIKSADVIIRPHNWEVNGASGIKAYLKTLYVTIEEDAFEKKYANLPDSATSAVLDDDDVEG